VRLYVTGEQVNLRRIAKGGQVATDHRAEALQPWPQARIFRELRALRHNELSTQDPGEQDNPQPPATAVRHHNNLLIQQEMRCLIQQCGIRCKAIHEGLVIGTLNPFGRRRQVRGKQIGSALRCRGLQLPSVLDKSLQRIEIATTLVAVKLPTSSTQSPYLDRLYMLAMRALGIHGVVHRRKTVSRIVESDVLRKHRTEPSHHREAQLPPAIWVDSG